MKTLEKMASMNANNIESESMNKLFGGAAASPCTADTTTVTPSGSSNDGSDSYEGECGVGGRMVSIY